MFHQLLDSLRCEPQTTETVCLKAGRSTEVWTDVSFVGQERFTSRATTEAIGTVAEATRLDAALAALPVAVKGRLRARQSGVALLEVLVTFVITSLALAVLFDAVAISLQASRDASRYEQAVERARSHLTMAIHDSPLVAGDWAGDDGGGFTWRLHVTPVASTSVSPAYAVTQHGTTAFPLKLYSVRVDIAWLDENHTKEVHLETERIGQGLR